MAALLRCSVCSERLSADDFASSLCRFHVGAYGASGSGSGGNLAVWRCCNAVGETAPGCAAGCHVRDESQPAQQAGEEGSDDDEAACLDRSDADGGAAAPSEPFINVILAPSDTLAGVALRYNTTPEARSAAAVVRVPLLTGAPRAALARATRADCACVSLRPAQAIMAANAMMSPLSFNARRLIRVPTQDPPPPGLAPDRRLLVQRVAAAASARRGSVATAEEASAYLDLAGGDVTKALRAMSEDADWENRCVATAFEARRSSGDGGTRAAVAAAAAAVAGGLRAVRSSIASAVAAGGGGAGSDVEDDKMD